MQAQLVSVFEDGDARKCAQILYGKPDGCIFQRPLACQGIDVRIGRKISGSLSGNVWQRDLGNTQADWTAQYAQGIENAGRRPFAEAKGRKELIQDQSAR